MQYNGRRKQYSEDGINIGATKTTNQTLLDDQDEYDDNTMMDVESDIEVDEELTKDLKELLQETDFDSCLWLV